MNDLDGIKEMVRSLMDLYDIAYENVKKDVEYIILNGITDEIIIDHVFDNILNIPTDKCYRLFVDLCDYVSCFNEQMANEYMEIYKELYGDDEVNTSMKI